MLITTHNPFPPQRGRPRRPKFKADPRPQRSARFWDRSRSICVFFLSGQRKGRLLRVGIVPGQVHVSGLEGSLSEAVDRSPGGFGTQVAIHTDGP